jgi:hypothetical protein
MPSPTALLIDPPVGRSEPPALFDSQTLAYLGGKRKGQTPLTDADAVEMV